MAEDRFANVYTAALTMSGINALTFVQLNFGLNLRDKIAVVIDQLYIYMSGGMIAEITTTGDRIAFAVTMGDTVTSVFSEALTDRRIVAQKEVIRLDAGTAATAIIIEVPLKMEFMPPILVLPTRLFFAMDTVGLASAGVAILRMHYRTVNITQQDQLIEVLETFQLSN